MAFTTLISTDEFAARSAGSAGWIAVDCRYNLGDPAWGDHQYLTAHIPGAVLAHLGRDLAGTPDGTNGRHPLPAPDTLAATFGRLGIANGMQVVAYDQDAGSFASRLWWLLRWLGHDAVAVLDGGFAKWIAEGRPVDAGHNARAAQRFTGQPRPGMTADVAEVTELVGSRDALLVDARAPERYRGDLEPIDRVAGHIPGAVNHYFQENVGDNGLFRSRDELRARLSAALGAIPAERVVCYCGSGVTACHNLLALEHAGMHGAKLYAGSWSEWSSDPSRPVDRSTS